MITSFDRGVLDLGEEEEGQKELGTLQLGFPVLGFVQRPGSVLARIRPAVYAVCSLYTRQKSKKEG